MNNICVSCTLTEHVKQETTDGKTLVKRIADYQYYDGRSKSMATANFTILGWEKTGELLAKAPAGKEVVCEGRMQILVKDRPSGSGKDRRLEVSLSRLHTN